MQTASGISRIGDHPALRYRLHAKRDLPLLQLIRDSTFITRSQLEILIRGKTDETNYDSRNRRLRRLEKLGQIVSYEQAFPYEGRVFAVTDGGLHTLQMAGMSLMSVTSETENPNMVRQIPHYLCLNELRIALSEVLQVVQWIDDRQLTSLNLIAQNPTTKDYDAVMEAFLPGEANRSVLIGIEYERTIKSRDRYAEIRKALSTETQMSALLYFVDTENDALLISREVFCPSLPIGTIVIPQFRQSRLDTHLRTVKDQTIVRMLMRDFLAKTLRT